MEVEVENLVKQRFVGILVILSVGIILWPLIFAPHEKVERLPLLIWQLGWYLLFLLWME